jgi:endonuclease/exonuclease/phosphatase family metal-dependent hydrolase
VHAAASAGGCVDRDAAAEDGASLKVLSFNLYGRAEKKQTRLGRTHDLLCAERADIVALQEVSRGWLQGGDALPRLAALAYPEQAYQLLYRHAGLWEAGLATLSRFPIRDARGAVFRDNAGWQRKGYLWLQLDTPWGLLVVVNTHLAAFDEEPTRVAQVGELLDAIGPAGDAPVLLLGDLNATPDSPTLRLLGEHGFVRTDGGGPDLPTWAPYGDGCAGEEAQRLDYVLWRPGRAGTPWPARGGVRASAPPHASDHCPVWAEVTAPPAP